MGDYGVGKTSLIKRFVFNDFGESITSRIIARESLKYMQFTPHAGGNTFNVRLSINDVGNVRHPREVDTLDLTDVDGILLVADLTNQDSFVSYDDWVDVIKEMPKLNAIAIIGNKTDTSMKEHELEESDLESYATSLKTAAFLTSAKTGEGVEEVFSSVVRQCMELDVGIVRVIGPSQAAGSAGSAQETSRERYAREREQYRDRAPAPPSGTAGGRVDETQALSPAQRALRDMRMKHMHKRTETRAKEYVDNYGEVHLKYGGYSYLIKEERPEKSFRAFCELLEDEHEGLCIARQYPDEIRENFEIGETPIYWLTRSGTDKTHLSVNLSRLSSFIKRFIDENRSPVLMLEGLEYLIIQNDFMSVLKFIQLANEYIRMKRACLVVPFNPDVLGERDLSLLEREMVVIKP
ncbi:MAG: DUF835 domain-containing protein [Thermoplasmata archaeon]|nr:MAG: DUF835 domain-containing protein [Thermoplasmata archaeon]